MRRALLGTLVALLAAGVWFGRRPDTPESDVVVGTERARSVPTTAVLGGADASSNGPGARVARPRSLRGTRVDGGFVVDADGHLVPTLEARRLFDYVLTATGEVGNATLHDRIEHEIARRLHPPADREATALLERYLVYRERVRALATATVPDDDDLDARLTALVALRREVLGPDAAEAFFADEEADARRLLAARRIGNDPSLTPEERAARIAALDAAAEAELPDDVRAAHAVSRLATTLRGAEAEIRARGGDDTEVADLRERLAGPEAAARLADLDGQRRAWHGRVEAFRAARERVQHDAALTPETRAAAVARLLEESFTPAERRRVEALDRIAAGTASSQP